ncbi:hypothetical protein IWQ60_011086 [Tieghemiomyces parasiticus]|uniref:Alanine--tRNA ligase n=1 Tax=Tieghemiomyces parasiticus TaxID=78921 RepID=A0A9W7ZPR5_9FUNG|nr:hypothetical protein IWQ60_011086 [Tieghemiomyces parasiticus]
MQRFRAPVASLPNWGRQRRLLTSASSRLWTGNEIRQRFLDHFQEQGHQALPSSGLVPKADDRSLLFTNAGMVQFKDQFLRPQSAPFKRVTTVQKCLRAGGKHNDLDNVGFTPRHHTFFEMLGNFSFGGYDKLRAIQMAWAFLTEVLHLPKARLRVSVLTTDTESYAIWRHQVGVPSDRIDQLGEADNFWSMGHGEGPCGPCTEIFWDTGAADPEARWLEIWNLVFMEYHRDAAGTLTQLPTLCVDTGMGLERLTSVLQDVPSNFETDLFRGLLDAVAALPADPSRAGVTGNRMIAPNQRIIADHLRASGFLLAEGVVPGNAGRGYVLRRIIRRAVRAGQQLGIEGPFLTQLYPALVASLGKAYPELGDRTAEVVDQLGGEEDLFRTTLSKGLQQLERTFRTVPTTGQTPVVDAATAFYLYDTHGFPVDLVDLIARERGWTVDLAGFDQLREVARQRSQDTWQGRSPAATTKGAVTGSHCQTWQDRGFTSTFTGYHLSQAESTGRILSTAPLDQGRYAVLVDPCPFYGLGGGQAADRGRISSAITGADAEVLDVTQPYPGATVLTVRVDSRSNPTDPFPAGTPVTCKVDLVHRRGLAVHHSATHLLNAALRRVTGQTVEQMGSSVTADRLRFDFTSAPLTADQLASVETFVNEAALAAVSVAVDDSLTLVAAKARGALGLAGDTYGETVRVVEFPGLSSELCCGTHVANTSQLYPFKILSEGSVAARVRRIEAVAGPAAVAFLNRQYDRLDTLACAVQTNPARLESAVQSLVSDRARLEQRLGQLTARLVTAEADPQTVTLAAEGHPVYIYTLDTGVWADSAVVAKRAQYLRETHPGIVHIMVRGPHVIVSYSGAQLQAGMVLRRILTPFGGKGGGKPEQAQGRVGGEKAVKVDSEFTRICVAAVDEETVLQECSR